MYSLCTAFSATPLYLYVMRLTLSQKIIRLLSSLCLLLLSASAFSQACDPVLVEVGGGSYISEISWEILNSDGDVVADGQYDGVSIVCLDADDCLTLNLFDTFGDGWNGNTIVIGDLFSGTLPGGSAGTFDIGNCQPQECLDSLLEVAWENPDSIPGLGFSIQTPDGNGVLTGDGFFQGYACLDLQACYDVVLSNGLSSSGNGYNATLTIGDSSFVWSGGWSVEFPLAIGCDNTGCDDPLACNYDPEAIILASFVCTYPVIEGVDCDGNFIEGCTYDTAINYNPLAVIEDGSCEFFPAECLAYGCTYMGACNYDAQADCDDGSCVFAENGVDCAGFTVDPCGPGTYWDEIQALCIPTLSADLDMSGCVGMYDLLEMLSQFGICYQDEWSCGDVLNYHGYDYTTVQVDDLCWFADNLRTEHYSNGDPIPSNVPDSALWTTQGAQTFFELDLEYLEERGRLYNAYAVVDERGLCPAGWHAASDDDFISMEEFIGLSSEDVFSEGEMGCEEGLAASIKSELGWLGSGSGTNATGLNFSKTGYHSYTDSYANTGFGNVDNGTYWTSSSYDGVRFWRRQLSPDDNCLRRNWDNPWVGMGVRCIQDSQ